MSENKRAVKAALDAAGIQPSPEEVALLIEMYPDFRRMADAMYEVLEAEEEGPELVFDVRT